MVYKTSISKKFPLSENEKLNPKNFYGMTKKLNEDIAKRFFENYKFKSIGLRFFTVFGEWGRPDMFLIKYLDAAYNKKIFFLNNYGNHIRDFTYINDVTKIIEVSSSNKLKDFLNGKKTTYAERKKISIQITRDLLNKNNSISKWMETFNKSKKKDDLADCFLQGLWYIKHKIKVYNIKCQLKLSH